MSRWGQLGGVPRGDCYDDRWRRLEAAGKWPHGEADLVCWFAPATVLDAGCGTGRVAAELDRRGVRVVGVDLDRAMLDAARAKAPHLTWIHADLVDATVDAPPSAGVPAAADEGSPAGASGSPVGAAGSSGSPVDSAGSPVGAAGSSGSPVDSSGSPPGSPGSQPRRGDARQGGFDVVVMAGNVMVFVAPGTEAAVVANMARHLRPGGRLVAGFQLGRSPLTVEAYDRAAAAAGLAVEHRWSTWERDAYDGGDYVVLVHRA